MTTQAPTDLTPPDDSATEPAFSAAPLPDEVTAGPGRYYRNARYIMTVVLLAMGAWFAYDGYVKYPAENAKLDGLQAEQTALQAQKVELENNITLLKSDGSPQEKIDAAEKALADKNIEITAKGEEIGKISRHSDTDLLIQRALGWSLPPLGIALLIWTFYNSRGTLRYKDGTLYIPGHPPVPLSAIDAVDRRLWDRKGIAYLNYTLPDGKSGVLRLDDFVYDRKPTDEIFRVVEETITTTPPAGVDPDGTTAS